MGSAYYTNAHERQLWRVLPDLIRGRQLLLDLVWKDVRVRYRYAVMGFLWAVIEPLIMMAVLTFVFAYVFQMRFPGVSGEGTPRETAVNILTGLIAWQFFSTGIASATQSLTESRNLITKVRFAREVIPLASIGVSLVNLAIGGVLLLFIYSLLLWQLPGVGVLWLPAIFSIELATVCGLGLLFSALHVSFRDVGYMVNAALLFGFYASPIFYQPSLVEDAFPRLYSLYFANPMAGLITAYRDALFLNQAPSIRLLWWPTLFALMSISAGLVVFRKRSPTMADQL
jgi:lipopolysaccharide transport system permease protein